jgi:hypothetical protein
MSFTKSSAVGFIPLGRIVARCLPKTTHEPPRLRTSVAMLPNAAAG